MGDAPPSALPASPPFVLRGRLVTPLAAGGTLDEPDGAVAVDAAGRIVAAGQTSEVEASLASRTEASWPVVDVRPWLILPGLVDLHAHLPQIPSMGLGSGLHLLDWLDRYVYPLERAFDADAARALAPTAYAAFASLGTTTVVLHGAAWRESVDEAFGAAEASGLRVVLGRVMMDRRSYRDEPPERRLDVELRESAELCERWHGRDGGRLAYAFTPRFAVACTAELLRESAALATSTGAFWQTHVSEDPTELAEVARLFPEARDYVDVYDLAGGLGPRAILAHGIHLSDREIRRLAETGSRLVHCPESNLFLGSGAMRLATLRQAGIVAGLGSDVAGGPSLSLFRAMRSAAYVQGLVPSLAVLPGRAPEVRAGDAAPVPYGPLEWLRIATYEGARALGWEQRIGTLEAGREADLIVVDPAATAPLHDVPVAADASAEELVGRLMFRTHPAMVQGAWVRGRWLPIAGEAAR